MSKLTLPIPILVLQHPQEPSRKDHAVSSVGILEQVLFPCSVQVGLSWRNLGAALKGFEAIEGHAEYQKPSNWGTLYLGTQKQGEERVAGDLGAALLSSSKAAGAGSKSVGSANAINSALAGSGNDPGIPSVACGFEEFERDDGLHPEQDRWTEAALASLGASTLDNRLFAQSVAYFEELLPRYKIDHPGRGAGDGVLHRYYLGAADAYAGLGRTKDAIDRASAAVVLWPAGHREREEILEHLVRILQNAPKLDETIAALDAAPLQSAVVRQALGRALIRKNEHARAIPQLRLAAEQQPDDAEVYDLLVVCFDKIGDKEGAVRQLLDAVELSRREIKLYAELGRRLAELQRPDEAERANTTTVEMLPNESEGHTMLAEIRQKQNRWPEAIAHWERVAQIRGLEPTGLLKLAEAQIHEKSWAKAGESLRKLRNQKWPEQFKEVAKETHELEKRLEEGSRK